MTFVDFLNESTLNEAKINAAWAKTVLLFLNTGDELSTFGIKNEFSGFFKTDKILKKRAETISGEKSPRGTVNASFESLVNTVFGGENGNLHIDGDSILFNDKVVATIKDDSTWRDVIAKVPGLKAKLKAYHAEIKDQPFVKFKI